MIARDFILAVLRSCTECSVADLKRAIPRAGDHVEQMLGRLVEEGLVRRISRGVYTLRNVEPVPAAPAPQFIAPIPKHRLMAGR